jgi:hypothetical protein
MAEPVQLSKAVMWPVPFKQQVPPDSLSRAEALSSPARSTFLACQEHFSRLPGELRDLCIIRLALVPMTFESLQGASGRAVPAMCITFPGGITCAAGPESRSRATS